MPLLREQPKQPKSAMIQVRVEEEIKTNLDQYAEFIHSSEAWVVSEALRLLFRKDRDFSDWKTTHNGHDSDEPIEGEAQSKSGTMQ